MRNRVEGAEKVEKRANDGKKKEWLQPRRIECAHGRGEGLDESVEELLDTDEAMWVEEMKKMRMMKKKTWKSTEWKDQGTEKKRGNDKFN